MTTPATDRALRALTLPGLRGIARDASGQPWAATDGHMLVLRDVSDLDAARERLATSTLAAEEGDVTPENMIRVIDASDTIVGEGRLVTRDTVPDADLVAVALDAQRAAVGHAEAELVEAEATLACAPRGARKRPRERLAEVRKRLKAAKADHGLFHGVRVGPAVVDLRLVQRALRALGAREGTLRAGDGWSAPVLLTTAKGCALIAPMKA